MVHHVTLQIDSDDFSDPENLRNAKSCGTFVGKMCRGRFVWNISRKDVG